MFLDNKYTKLYHRIVNRALFREEPFLYEEHHIIPRALGGTNIQSNLVKLTLREHFIVHVLLMKMVTKPSHKRSMVYALLRMGQSHSKGSRIGNGRLYERVRREYREFYTGENASHFGHKHTDESKKKVSLSRIGKKWSQEMKEKFSRIHSEKQFRAKIYEFDRYEQPITIQNLKKYCRENGLGITSMRKVWSGRLETYNGFKRKVS